VQATSYWDTLFGFFEFCGCSPAYTVPALPSGLNAEPGAEAELPGGFGVASQLAFGCPVLKRALAVVFADTVVDLFGIDRVVLRGAEAVVRIEA
jgi:hypothetical protein